MKVGNWEEYSIKQRTSLLLAEGTGDLVVLEHSPDILPLVTRDIQRYQRT